MSAVEEFFESEAFFPILVGLLVLLIATLLWVTLSNRRARKKMMVPQNSMVDESATIKVVQDPEPGDTSSKSKVVPDVPMVAKAVPDTPMVEEPKEENVTAVNEVPVNNDLPLVDIAVPKVDETPVDLELPGEAAPSESGEAVTIEPAPEGVTEIPKPGEEVNIELPVKKDDEPAEGDVPAFTVGEIAALTNEVGEPAEVMASIEVPENAFAQLPTDDNTINDNPVIEEPKEYTGEKTEVFNFPDFKDNATVEDITAGSLADQSIESDVYEAANKYIASIMSK